MNRRMGVSAIVLLAACRDRGPAASAVDDAESGMATFATVGSSTSAGDDGGFDPCAIAMYGSLEVIDLALAGDLERDGLPELLVLGYPAASATPVLQAIALDGPQPEPGPNGGMLVERVVQEVRFGPGFVSLAEMRVAGLGDIDGDGYVDLGVASFIDEPAGERVRTFVLFGEATPAPSRELRVDGGDGRIWLIDGPLAELAYEDDYSERIVIGRIDDMTGDGRDELHVHPAHGRISWVVFGTGEPSSPLQLGDLAADATGFRIIQPGDASVRLSLFALPTSVPRLDGDAYGDLVVSHYRAFPDSAPTSGDAVGRFGGPTQPDLDLNDLDGQDWTVRVASTPRYVFSIGVIPDDDGTDQTTQLWLAGPVPAAIDFEYDGCQSDIGPPSMFRLLDNPTMHGDLEDLWHSGAAVPAFVTDCPSGFRLAAPLDWNGDGLSDLALTSTSGGFAWFDGRDLGVDRLPLSLASRFWDVGYCTAPDGVLRRPATHEHYGIVGGPDLDGDGLDEIAVTMSRLTTNGNRSARVAVFAGQRDWDEVGGP